MYTLPFPDLVSELFQISCVSGFFCFQFVFVNFLFWLLVVNSVGCPSVFSAHYALLCHIISAGFVYALHAYYRQ